ncbi:MAG: hypothetical protein RLZZ150_424 [Bacteroidota bacterium]|jgi:hypothetical protein
MHHDTFGLHLILLPAFACRIPAHAHSSLSDATQRICSQYGCRSVAIHAREDHLHVLVSAADERDMTRFVHALLDALRRTVVACGGPFRGFTWDPAVHVTLLPPWHIEILASFVRDQDRYHEHRTLEQELDDVFRPNALEPEEPVHVN